MTWEIDFTRTKTAFDEVDGAAKSGSIHLLNNATLLIAQTTFNMPSSYTINSRGFRSSRNYEYYLGAGYDNRFSSLFVG